MQQKWIQTSIRKQNIIEEQQPTQTNEKKDEIGRLLVEIAKLEEKYPNSIRGEKGHISRKIKAIKNNISTLKNKNI